MMDAIKNNPKYNVEDKYLKVPIKVVKVKDNYLGFFPNQSMQAVTTSAPTLTELYRKMNNSLIEYSNFLYEDNKKLSKLAIFEGRYSKVENRYKVLSFRIIGIGLHIFYDARPKSDRMLAPSGKIKFRGSFGLSLGRLHITTINLWKKIKSN